ncbi:MAG TPA: PEGA domain-containing protein, partial [Kofleriaceae bacterium]|nr:PEGA domain-containing protein [Kofleriaceae bacterium]
MAEVNADLKGPVQERLLRFGTRFDSEVELLRSFAPLVDGDVIFIATRSSFTVGLRRQFSVELRSGRAILRGEGEVIESPARLSGPDSTSGLRFRMLRLTGESLAFHARMLHLKEQRDEADDVTEVADPAALLSSIDFGDSSAVQANPLADLSDDALDDLIECVIHEDIVPAPAKHPTLHSIGSSPMEMSGVPEQVVIHSPPVVVVGGHATGAVPRMVKEVLTRPVTAHPYQESGQFSVYDGSRRFHDTGSFRYQESGPFPVPVHEVGTFRAHETGRFPIQESGRFPRQESRGFPLQESGRFPRQESRGFPIQESGHFPIQDFGVPTYADRQPAPSYGGGPAATARQPVLFSIGAVGYVVTALLSIGLGFFGGYLVFHEGQRATVATAPAPTTAAPATALAAAPPQTAAAPSAPAAQAPAPQTAGPPLTSPPAQPVPSAASAPAPALPPAPASSERAPVAASASAADAPAAAPPAREACSLTVGTRPSAARVLVDGKQVAVGPLAHVAVPCAELAITVEHPGFRTYVRHLTATSARPLKLQAELDRIDPPAPSRQLVVESE